MCNHLLKLGGLVCSFSVFFFLVNFSILKYERKNCAWKNFSINVSSTLRAEQRTCSGAHVLGKDLSWVTQQNLTPHGTPYSSGMVLLFHWPEWLFLLATLNTCSCTVPEPSPNNTACFPAGTWENSEMWINCYQARLFYQVKWFLSYHLINFDPCYFCLLPLHTYKALQDIPTFSAPFMELKLKSILKKHPKTKIGFRIKIRNTILNCLINHYT